MIAHVVLTTAMLAVSQNGAPEDHLERARAAFERAEVAYRLGRFEEALSEYERAYELYPRPELLFNIGQAQRSLRRWEDAIFSYELYLRDALDAPDRSEVRALIRELEVEADKEAHDSALHRQWWFWVAAGATVVAAGAVTAAVVAGGSGPDPMGTLGTFDYR